MITLRLILASIMMLSFTGCFDKKDKEVLRVDEKYAAAVVKNELSLPGDVFALDLKGGYSGAQLFKVTSASKEYVTRFIGQKSKEYREEEIYNLKVASDGGYGPRIYFADSSRGIVIMEYLSGKATSDMELLEYLSGKTISYKGLQPDQFYVALAQLLQKIHCGQAFKGSGDYVFDNIRKGLQTSKPKYSDYVPLIKIERLVSIIYQALLPHITTTTPCHNDLHRGNMIFVKNEFKAFDYECASQGDPFFDVATVAASFFCKPTHENILFTTYLKRQPSKVELAKLYLMKQAVWIKWFFDGLRRLSPEIVSQFGVIKTTSIVALAGEVIGGKIDMNMPENKLKVLKAQLNEIFDNSESQEFKKAIDVLSKK
ncbi:MAG: phosphotransferase [bacterium]